MAKGLRARLLDDLQVPEVYREPADLPRQPVRYTDEIANDLCAHIAKGKSVASFCEQPGRPTEDAIYKWLRERPALVSLYTRAREDAAFRAVDEILVIADRDDLEPRDKAIRITARQWIAARHAPRLYGEAIARMPPASELLAIDADKRRDLRRQLLQDLSDLARPAPLVIEHET